MRLLHTSTLELETFQRECPPYAILSHTWEANEAAFVTFLPKPRWRRPLSLVLKRKYPKVVQACALARSKGYEWIWIDTCCIDKSSSAELSEAINSMFKWYQKAQVCFAYLVDVPHVPRGSPGSSQVTLTDDIASSLAGARWFTRGWTLQELIAPSEVEFYDQSWSLIGTKTSLAPALEEITGIPAGMFSPAWHSLCAGGLAQQSLHLASVAQRLSWAAGRETTRPEDLAYCLMGLFEVHLPPLYGEGLPKAFARLQAEIARNTNDQSLFAWGSWFDPEGCEKLLCYSLFAEHPNCFAAAGLVRALSWLGSSLDWTPPFETPNDGYLRIRMRVCKRTERGGTGFMDDDHIAFLECDIREERDAVVGMFVRRLEDAGGVQRYVRVHQLLGKFPKKRALDCELEDVLLGALPRHIPRFDILGTRTTTRSDSAKMLE